ncbi:hypothetical protein L1049_015107 [Liquidambar formosana]|uniref:Uncharacterized protein n=1 Tax=Liquidambar formosana TaxID=63359 RepID=A0AAP0WZH6_LIQFO
MLNNREMFSSVNFLNNELARMKKNIIVKKQMSRCSVDAYGFSTLWAWRIVGVAHVEDFESVTDASKRAACERQALKMAKMLLKERRKFHAITEVVSAIRQIHSQSS